MARCEKCHHKWKIKDVWLLGFSKKGKECSECSTKQFASFKDSGGLVALGHISGIVAILLIIFFPFVVRLSEKDEIIF